MVCFACSFQQLAEWNARYYQKFGFVFLICASGRSTEEILAELKVKFLTKCFLIQLIYLNDTV